MITLKEINEIEKKFIPEELMEMAGKEVAKQIEKNYPEAKSFLLIAGKGSNAGGGFVAMRELKGEKIIYAVKGNPSELTYKKFHELKEKEDIAIENNLEFALTKADVVIDALLGIGLKEELREDYKKIIDTLNKSSNPVVSVDVPSGLDIHTGKGYCVKPELVVTFFDTKKGLDNFNTVVVLREVKKKALG